VNVILHKNEARNECRILIVNLLIVTAWKDEKEIRFYKMMFENI
jgi:hypothetical protein